MTFRLVACLLVACALLLEPARGAGLVTEDFRIPMAEAGPEGLEAVLVKPETPGRHPLALVSHGSPRNIEVRPLYHARGMVPQLTEFARRGFVAVTFMRRGYGSSPGGPADAYGRCDDPSYIKAGRAGAADLRAAIAALSRRPDVDASTIIAVGVSAGGFATIALTADPPPGLVAAISFAGGRGSRGPDSVCHDERLVDAFRFFGKTSRIPMLWVYAHNDHFFDPPLVTRLFEAFSGAGGHAELMRIGDYGTEGHVVFTADGRPVWTPIVDTWLERRHLLPPTPVVTSAPAR